MITNQASSLPIAAKPSTFVAIGWDPSTVGAAWARLHVSTSHREYVESGSCSTDREIEEKLRSLPADALIGIEVPQGIHTQRNDAKAARARGVALMKTRGVAASIATIARMLGFEHIVEMSPGQCRSMIGLGRAATDADVQRVLRIVLPSLPTRSNNHERDAAVCAFAAVTRHGFQAFLDKARS